ncbi:glycosyltransferase family 2 protein [Plantactinospora sp. KLBMP9567]|uniref:glycosyltransferase family 2 protein n=1 Tax=Plantactinospora sp. KLBMP9567 TaxID=3085900 RepID=UPI00298194E9|nr:glycosyltransferase [Plantactinospora sp. KLBMP9567]MDW5328903.1 glycosyltransferase [Plantactinospora sp. KLBMP9567]
MGKPTFSVAIPYRQRLPNLRRALTSLAEQTMDSSRFEVVVGAIDYSPEYVAVCQDYADRLTIVTVMVNGGWNCSRARNLALRQVSGRILLLMDADMVLPSSFLQNLHEKYYSGEADVCLVGQMIDYRPDGVYTVPDGDVPGSGLPYEHYRAALAELQASPGVRLDRRLDRDPAVAWTGVWAGLVAIPVATVQRHGLSFDENFHGWGFEDVEWGYRVWRSGTPIIMREDVYGVHQPHFRSGRLGDDEYRANGRYFLAKWPNLEVELLRAFGPADAARWLGDARREMTAVTGGGRLGVITGSAGGGSVLVVGVTLDDRQQPADATAQSLLDQGPPDEVLSLIGCALPHPDQSIERCFILPRVQQLSPRYRDAVLNEVGRVARVVTPVVAPA